MLNLPILRWGKPYDSLEVDQVVHFATGEPIAKVSQANGGLLQRDMRFAQRARDVLRELSSEELIARVKKAGDLYVNATLPMGDGQQSPEEFALQQSASTGLPEHMCRGNMQKNFFVLSNMDRMLDALTRGLDLSILSRGYGVEGRGVVVSFQAQAPRRGVGIAVEFAGSAHAVDACDSDASRPGSEAGPSGTLDSLPHGSGIRRGRYSARSDLDLPRWR